MNKIQNKDILYNLIRQPLLRNTLLISVLTAVFFPIYSFYYIFPQFNNQLTRYTEDAAIRVATHLKEAIYTQGLSLTERSFTKEVIDDIIKLKKDLRIEKIKIFSHSGVVLFSSNEKDIGKKNQHDYFYTKIALGKTYSKAVKKNTKTMEGRVVNSEVVESYVPLMQKGVFNGAVEIYYDITENREALTTLLNSLKITIITFPITFLFILFLILFKASRNRINKEVAEGSLQKAHAQLEQIVETRTKDLKKTNRFLEHEVKVRTATEISLQRSHDIQTIVNKLLRESLGDSTVVDVIDNCLDSVLSLSWLSFDSMGCIYLVEDIPDVLAMKAHRGFSKDLQRNCSKISFGKCLCGLAASNQKTIFASHLDDRHDILLPGTPDHGHYCIPLIAKSVTLGVINIYVKPGHKRNEQEENFLKTLANTLTGILIQRYGETEKKEIEKKLHQAQKMESIGTLAGGIAHDFNNILTGIFGYAQLTAMNLDKPEKAKQHIEQINKGAKRATDLIQQILTFSRQSEHEKIPIKLYLIVKEATKFLRSSIPADIKIIENISSRAKVKADTTQIHQIVMNLCTNAYHAMIQTGGELSITLTQVEIHKFTVIEGLNVIPGPYLRLEVNDTGVGIRPEILNKIFEPYFTTKKMSEGTGLGLAVVLGIVEEHNGYIKARSKLGEGSTFQVYLPVFDDEMEHAFLYKTQQSVEGGTENIMIVDDEESILASSSELLADYGYKVKGFLDVDEAYEAFKQNKSGFDLIITDMTMPNMTGDDFAQKILAIRDDTPIILCTGYNNKISKNKALKLGIKKYFQKPVEANILLASIRSILDENKI